MELLGTWNVYRIWDLLYLVFFSMAEIIAGKLGVAVLESVKKSSLLT